MEHRKSKSRSGSHGGGHRGSRCETPPPPYPGVEVSEYFMERQHSACAPPLPHLPQRVATISGGNVRYGHSRASDYGYEPPPLPTRAGPQQICILGPESVRVQCPSCHADVWTRVSYRTGKMTHICCMVLFCFICWPCAWLPYVSDCTKDAKHKCPRCSHLLGTYKR